MFCCLKLTDTLGIVRMTCNTVATACRSQIKEQCDTDMPLWYTAVNANLPRHIPGVLRGVRDLQLLHVPAGLLRG